MNMSTELAYTRKVINNLISRPGKYIIIQFYNSFNFERLYIKAESLRDRVTVIVVFKKRVEVESYTELSKSTCA